MNFTKVKILFLNTIQKEARSRTILFLSIITILMLVLTSALLKYLSTEVFTTMASGDVGNSFLSGFLVIINIWTFLLSIYLGVNTIRSDFDAKVAIQLLSFPIKRYEYLLSRLLGVTFLVTFFYIFCVVCALISFSLSSNSFVGDWKILIGVIINFFSILSCVGISMLVSLYFNKLAGLISTFFLTLFIYLSNSYFSSVELSSIWENFSIFKGTAALFHILFPHLGRLSDLVNSFVLGGKVNFSVHFEAIHFIFSSCFIFFLMSIIFKKREL